MKLVSEFAGKTALVTGSARGIGLSIANRFAEEGAHVFIADVAEEKGKKVVRDLRERGFNAEFIDVDLSLPGGGKLMVERTASISGRVDILVNNARGGLRLGLLEESEKNWDETLSVSLKAAFFAAQAAIRLMASLGGSRVVNVGSVAAISAGSESPSYHASKSGLLHLTRYLAVAGGPYSANVNCVLPGFIVQEEHRPRFDSESNAAYRAVALSYQPLGEVGAEKDVAEAVLYLCSERARYVSGACLTLDGAATAQEPFGLLLRQSVARAQP